MLGVLHYLLILCFGIGQITSYEGIEGGCEIDLSVPNFPVVIKSNTSFRYHPAFSPGIKKLGFGSEVEFHCPGSSILLRGEEVGRSMVYGTCTPHDDNNYARSELSCKSPKVARIILTDIICQPSAQIIRIYYELPSERKLYILSVCFKIKEGIPHFSHHYMFPTFFNMAKGTPVDFDSIKVDKTIYVDSHIPNFKDIYNPLIQQERINRLVDIELTSNTFINIDSMHYLVPTFLASPDDFYYKDVQGLMKRFINVVPQWKTIRDNNWQKVEQQVRTCIMGLYTEVKIWTGTCRSVKLSSYRAHNVPIFLGTKDKFYPVPLLLWKLVYNMRTKKAVVLIVFNDPYYDNKRGRFFCSDISDKTGWMRQIDQYNATKGYSYVCSYNDFRRICPLPTYSVNPSPFRCVY